NFVGSAARPSWVASEGGILRRAGLPLILPCGGVVRSTSRRLRHGSGCSRHDVTHRTSAQFLEAGSRSWSRLPSHLGGFLVRAPSAPYGMPQPPVLGAFGVLDLAHQIRAHPLGIT